MTELEKLCEEALYETVQTLEDGRSIVRDNASGKLFYKKRLAVFDTKVFDWLKAHRSRYVPKIESYWQDGDELVVIEELIQGETLEQLLSENENSLPFEERIRILTEVCDGLAFLHSADPPIIHRDLKASNIMLTEDGLVKIIDYDAAKLYVEGQTRDTQLIGTQGIAAPEQYGFAASDVRTDIYALGKLLERLLPGNADAARIVSRATRIDPKRRYSSAAQIREPIRRIRERSSGLDRVLEEHTHYDAASRRQRITARVFILLACVLFVCLLGFAYRQLVIAPREREELVMAAQEELRASADRPKEIAEKSRQLLDMCAYEKLDPEMQSTFREIGMNFMKSCTSFSSGVLQETGMYVSEAGLGYLDMLREKGVDEETVKRISLGGQLAFVLAKGEPDRALAMLPGFKGLPEEESAREEVYAACREAVEKKFESFRENPGYSKVTDGFTFLEMLKDAGWEEAVSYETALYEEALQMAENRTGEKQYNLADRYYRILAEYEESVPHDKSRPAIAERIKENRYREAEHYAGEGSYAKAAAALAEISGYRDADAKCLEMKYNHCLSVSEEPDDQAYAYIEELAAAGYPGAQELRGDMNSWRARVETGIALLVGSQQQARIRATLVAGPPEGSTHVRFEIIDLDTGQVVVGTSEEACRRGENTSVYYTVNSYTANIFERDYTVNVYADDGTRIGTWTGRFPKEFLRD